MGIDRCVIIAGAPGFADFSPVAGDYIIAADSGYRHALSAGIKPDSAPVKMPAKGFGLIFFDWLLFIGKADNLKFTFIYLRHKTKVKGSDAVIGISVLDILRDFVIAANVNFITAFGPQ